MPAKKNSGKKGAAATRLAARMAMMNSLIDEADDAEAEVLEKLFNRVVGGKDGGNMGE